MVIPSGAKRQNLPEGLAAALHKVNKLVGRLAQVADTVRARQARRMEKDAAGALEFHRREMLWVLNVRFLIRGSCGAIATIYR